MIKAQLDSREVLEAFRELEKKGGNLKPVFEDVGEYLGVSTRRRFKDKEAPDGTPWARNSRLTQVMKGSDDPLVGESKSLGRQFSYNATAGALEFGSTMKYAAVQHFGAKQGEFGVSDRGTPLPWGDIPARPILGISRQDEDVILDIVRDYLSAASGRL
ncbi:phage virion morphogenesis protein [Marinobacter shengliensis]|uniref:phage virion morphogenesis protein n=1 Tax=Marinobacter shengliensis TaxID=1389223 RepID=UPI00257307DC|nr:phage virion morphogenesis protein [Marinobacter shengliensis]BEH14264.1 virion morphogenesis protein [Marinobacter shengliensis]